MGYLQGTDICSSAPFVLSSGSSNGTLTLNKYLSVHASELNPFKLFDISSYYLHCQYQCQVLIGVRIVAECFTIRTITQGARVGP